MDNEPKTDQAAEVPQANVSQTVTTAFAAPPPRRRSWPTHVAGTSMYGFELLMATFGLTTAAIVIDYGMFAFFNYVKGSGTGYNTALFGEFSLWIVAAMLVWLPLSIAFYLRTCGELATTPGRYQATLHKVVISIYRFVNVLIAAGGLFAIFYSIIRLLVNGADGEQVGDVLVRVTVPALLVIGVHGWVLMAYSRSQRITRKVFSIVVAGLGLLVMIGLLVTSVGAIRGRVIDDKKERDLSVLSTAISEYYTDKRSLPKSLDDVEDGVDKLNMSLDEYSFIRQGANKYELCAKFDTSTMSASSKTSNQYSMYPSFTYHDKGNHCFKVQVSTYTPLNLNDNYDYTSPYESSGL